MRPIRSASRVSACFSWSCNLAISSLILDDGFFIPVAPLKSGRCTCDAQTLPDALKMTSADLQIAKGDAFVNDPAVPKERFQGRNYTSRCDALLLGPVGPSFAATPDELDSNRERSSPWPSPISQPASSAAARVAVSCCLQPIGTARRWNTSVRPAPSTTPASRDSFMRSFFSRTMPRNGCAASFPIALFPALSRPSGTRLKLSRNEPMRSLPVI
ncbi:hypothetical protein AGR6A_pAt20014 [Agrobacterium sp. NCPPB 925]|nr:hypothetical protein AGR6A_pAt20014 [Agrobacterium sp. NCPPB 925]